MAIKLRCKTRCYYKDRIWEPGDKVVVASEEVLKRDENAVLRKHFARLKSVIVQEVEEDDPDAESDAVPLDSLDQEPEDDGVEAVNEDPGDEEEEAEEEADDGTDEDAAI